MEVRITANNMYLLYAKHSCVTFGTILGKSTQKLSLTVFYGINSMKMGIGLQSYSRYMVITTEIVLRNDTPL